MENALKMLLGVVALSGVVALLVPSASPVAPPFDPGASQAVAPPPPTQAVIEEDDEADAEGDDAELNDEDTEEEDFTFGEPSIDGQPFGGNAEALRNGSATVIEPNNPGQTTPAPPANSDDLGQ